MIFQYSGRHLGVKAGSVVNAGEDVGTGRKAVLAVEGGGVIVLGGGMREG